MEDARVSDEHALLEEGLDHLRRLLGEPWRVDVVNRPLPVEAAPWMVPSTPERLVSIYSPLGGVGGQVLVEATRNLTPAKAIREIGPKLALMHNLTGSAAILVIAPWLSPRTRETLDKLGYGYLDLTGNVSIRLQHPAVFIRTEGAKQDPHPQRKPSRQQLRGARAGRLVRVLVDAQPPYRAAELADASSVSLSYVSRLLDALEEEALIIREARSVTAVDWINLIRARASQYSLLGANPYVSMLAPQGPEIVLKILRDQRKLIERIGHVALTGTFATRSIVRNVAVGGQLMLYVPSDPRQNGPLEKIAANLGLFRTETGADVLMLRAANEMVFRGVRRVDGIPNVALSQLALDSLGGTGRMPEEGEELLAYMAKNEKRWRAPNVQQLPWMRR